MRFHFAASAVTEILSNSNEEAMVNIATFFFHRRLTGNIKQVCLNVEEEC